jgi:hypothetical protein
MAWTDTDLARRGFTGFARMADLMESTDTVPRTRGVYAISRKQTTEPVFLAVNPGGRFKGKDPTLPVTRLERKWIVGTSVLYIGKADDLRARIDLLTRFGQGAPVFHWGGRALWQIDGSRDFRVAWTPTPDADPWTVEADLLHAFKDVHGNWPFANLQAPRKRDSGAG